MKRTSDEVKTLNKKSDEIFINQFKIMMAVLNIKRKKLAEEFNVDRKSLYLVLENKGDDPNISQKNFNTILALMSVYYKKYYNIYFNKINLILNENQIKAIKTYKEYLNKIHHFTDNI